MLPHFETLAIGDEILTGKISDSNSTFVAQKLFEQGWVLGRQNVIPDNFEIIQECLLSLSKRCQAVVCFGGLGPTSDDRTVEALANLLKVDLIEEPKAKIKLEERYRSLGRVITSNSLKQVLIPENTRPLENTVGYAPGIQCKINDCQFFFLPGVPSEMRPMVVNSVLPTLMELFSRGGLKTYSHVFRCIGIPEARLQDLLTDLEARLPKEGTLGYRTSFPENYVIVYWTAKEKDSIFDEYVDAVRRITSPWCYTEQDLPLEEVVVERLRTLGWKIALAESCTGGLVAHRLSQVAHASECLWGGYTVYQVSAKEKMLGVKLDSPEQAVSAMASKKLAQNLFDQTRCDLTAAITGYMGPTGGTEADPIGTIYYSVDGKKQVNQRLKVLGRNRKENQWAASAFLLEAIRQCTE